MQLVSNDSRKEDISESEPILCQFDNSQRSEECSSSCEITAVGGDCVVDSDDLDINVVETSHLVNADHPQCRICLDIGGAYYVNIFFYLISSVSPFWNGEFSFF